MRHFQLRQHSLIGRCDECGGHTSISDKNEIDLVVNQGKKLLCYYYRPSVYTGKGNFLRKKNLGEIE